MNEKFLKLNQEKQQRILEAAILEFAEQGYTKASTDNIVINAGISKGSLFNYFTNKKTLYEDVLDYIIAKSEEEVIKQVKEIQLEDFYERLKQIIVLKHNYINQNKKETKVLRDYLYKKNHVVEERVKAYNRKQAAYVNKYLISYLDEDLLKQEVTIEDVIFLTTVVLQAVMNRQDQIIIMGLEEKNKLEVENQLDKYINILKYGMYKNNSTR